MLRTMMTSKIHRATVTQADLHYVGSVTVDEDLLDAADLLPGELVHIVDVTNGARLQTYTIAGERGSGVLGINGAAAHLVHPGDLVILIGYGQMETAEARDLQPQRGVRRRRQPDRRHRQRPGRGGAGGRAATLLARRRGPALVSRRRGPSWRSPRCRGPPGWETYADVVVIGSGIAGLTAALRIREVLPAGGSVMVVTKDILSAGSTQWAQGGIAAALGDGDTPEQHLQDTLVAGAGVCDEEAVRVLVTEGPDAVRELIALGTNFDHTSGGELSLTREGGHHRDRIAHAGGDATGAEIQRALVAAIRRLAGDRRHRARARGRPDPGRRRRHRRGDPARDGRGAAGRHRRRACAARSCSRPAASARCSRQTTNPAVSTGDGMALALRAGAVLRDLEFVQFHPTVMWLGPDSRGQQPLISEAVRGEGAFLVDWEGTRFMQGLHELADLAPRDVVAKAITRRMHEEGKPHMWLDARHLGAEFWDEAVPDHPRHLPPARRRPGHRADPGRPRLPLRVGRRRHGPRRPVLAARPVRDRRGGLLRRPRRQPARLQLAPRGTGLLAPDRGGDRA